MYDKIHYNIKNKKIKKQKTKKVGLSSASLDERLQRKHVQLMASALNDRQEKYILK